MLKSKKHISQKYNENYKQPSATKTSLGKCKCDPQLYPVKETRTFTGYVATQWNLPYLYFFFFHRHLRHSLQDFADYFAEVKRVVFQGLFLIVGLMPLMELSGIYLFTSLFLINLLILLSHVLPELIHLFIFPKSILILPYLHIQIL